MDRRTVRVTAAQGAYDVVCAPGLRGLGAALENLGSPVVVTDETVAELWLEALYAEIGPCPSIVIGPGEANKTRETWWRIVDGLLQSGVDRRTPVVALGGGVVGDLAGFAAASTLRGLPLVQVPTTLLAMVDSSVGGKTGFNHPRGKNLVGAFHAPRLVWAPMSTLRTLAPRQVCAGLGEVVKTALIGDPALLERLEQQPAVVQESAALAEVVAACVAVKAEVVAQDERESGRRAVLNAGHTVGHAVEAVAGFGTWLHGEAVAMGLVAETAWAVRQGWCEEPGLPDRLRRVLGDLGLPVGLPALPRDALVRAMRLDKKVRGDRVVVPVPRVVGSVELQSIPRERLGDLLEAGS